MLAGFMEMEGEVRDKLKEVFKDLSKVALMHAFGIDPKQRGRGLATLMSQASIS